MDAIRVLLDKCSGCTLCVKVCPFGAITMATKPVSVENEKPKQPAVIDIAKCNLCGACVPICKFKAIIIEKKPEQQAHNINLYKDVWVFCEQKNGVIQSVSYELLGEGRALADALGVKLCAVFLGHNIHSKVNDLIHRGVELVYLAEAENLKDYQCEPYAKVLTKLIQQYKPEIVLCGATTIGRSLISRVAINLETGLTADCTSLAIDPEKKLLLQTRPAFGGNIMATIICPNRRPQMATVRHKVMKEAAVDIHRRGEVIKFNPDKEDLISRTSLIKIVEELEATVNLAEADIIVSGGRGLGRKEGFEMIREFAKAIGGAVGSSRAAVDSDWISYSHQVGQTGKTVCPSLYVACGISGQIQHLIGMQSSKTIIAINKDPSAPIFNIATYGIVGDIYEIIPALIKKFHKI